MWSTASVLLIVRLQSLSGSPSLTFSGVKYPVSVFRPASKPEPFKWGQKMTILPLAEPCAVKSILIDDEHKNQAFAGDNVVLILLAVIRTTSVWERDLRSIHSCPVATKFEARVVVFSSAQLPITKGLPVVIHYGNASEQAVVRRIVSQTNRSTGAVVKTPRCLTKNSSGVIVVEVGKPICVEMYSDNKDLGRFMLRNGGNTIAAGLIHALL